MFLKGFICGWIGMAAIVALLIWDMTPRTAAGAVEVGNDNPAAFIQDC